MNWRMQAQIRPVALGRWVRARHARQKDNENQKVVFEPFQLEGPSSQGVDDVIGLWTAKRQHARWKDLAQIALYYLSIPAISAERQRVSSGTKITLTARRCRLGDVVIDVLECLKSGQRKHLFEGAFAEIEEVDKMLEALGSTSM